MKEKATKWRESNKEQVRLYQKEYRIKNREKLMAYDLTEKHKNHRKLWWVRNGKQYCVARNKKKHFLAMQIVSNQKVPECCRCGCKDSRALEINHKNLGGRKENLRGRLLYDAIISGKRKTDDLEITCRVCNAAHYLEKKFDIHYDITFKGLGLSQKERAVVRREMFGNGKFQ